MDRFVVRGISADNAAENLLRQLDQHEDGPCTVAVTCLQQKFFRGASAETSTPSSSRPADEPTSSPTSPLGTVNPYTLGRQARKAFDQVWSQLANLGSPTKSFAFDETLEPSRDVDLGSAEGRNTTVLVVGATGRVGRVLTRKLLLRGYRVKALVRRRVGKERDDLNELPATVEIVEGDVGNMDSCQDAVHGINKASPAHAAWLPACLQIIYCAAARSTFTADLVQVDDRGVMNIAKAMQTWLCVALQRYHQQRWDVMFVGTAEEMARASRGDGLLAPFQSQGPDKYMASNNAVAEITQEDHLIFEGTLSQRGAVAEVGAELDPLLPCGDHRTAGTETITMRVRGDGQQYFCILYTSTGHSYAARVPTRSGYLNVRLPFSTFRAERNGQPVLDPALITKIGIRYDTRRAGPPRPAARAAISVGSLPTAKPKVEGSFCLEVDWIKTTPGGEESDIILVSCAGLGRDDDMPAAELQRVVAAKRSGEENLRLSGLGYTIIRPGRLVDEPGGYKALVFDQGDRIDQPISAADVADICLRSLREPAAQNKTFDVCYEVPSDGSSLYELVTSAPDKKGAYLAQAAASLAKNT
ncbi:hypothetical protein QJQ45_019831 [Haematococcus lacustris]|nr:hypothetical protein QJQ45_019831 [Haematococcus lacustris]